MAWPPPRRSQSLPAMLPAAGSMLAAALVISPGGWLMWPAHTPRLADWLAGWLQFYGPLTKPFILELFEHGDGSPPRALVVEDALFCGACTPRPDPIELPTDAGRIRVRGKIDRVDRVRFGDRGGLLVVDYKTGRLPAVTDITEGRNVQLVVYAAAAEAILKAECMGGAFHRVGPSGATSRQFFAAMKLSRGRYSPMEDFPEQRKAVLETIRGFVEGMGRGRFDMAPTHDCPSYCPYRQICQYSPARAQVKGAAEALEPRCEIMLDAGGKEVRVDHEELRREVESLAAAKQASIEQLVDSLALANSGIQCVVESADA
jgi:hypothetical protein